MGGLKEVLCARTFRHIVTRTLGVRTQWLGTAGQVDVKLSPQGAGRKQLNLSPESVSEFCVRADLIYGPRIQYGVLIVSFNMPQDAYIG